MKQIKWGILATGNIADKFATSLAAQEDATMLAVGSRSISSANTFADRWNIPRRYGSYQELANDPDIDVIYIATPHPSHHSNTMLCLHAGKHVLCEKPLTLNAAQAVECITLARQKNLFFMEAMWTRFIPAIVQLNHWLDEGVIGQVRLVTASITLNRPFDAEQRLFNLQLGGGALLDLGIYPLAFASMVLGKPSQITGFCHYAPTKVDELDAVTLRYHNGALAVLTCASVVAEPAEATITGTKGYIKVHDPFYYPTKLTLDLDGKQMVKEIPFESNGYIHEIREVHYCLKAGQTESQIMPLDETLEIFKQMDELRSQWGISYPME